jgi:putative nucleotidyltransferase with HDIG domain
MATDTSGKPATTSRSRGRRGDADASWLSRMKVDLQSLVTVLTRTVEVMDLYTSYHQRRVTQLACAIAREMEQSDAQVQAIYVAGLLHDIGNIYVPGEILDKPGLLNESDFRAIQDHASVGHYILSEINFPWPIATIVGQHHERMDGSGYPSGLSGEDILPEARVLAVADVVGAMTSIRRQRPPQSISRALDEIRQNRGVLYDALAVDACLALFDTGRFHFD